MPNLPVHSFKCACPHIAYSSTSVWARKFIFNESRINIYQIIGKNLGSQLVLNDYSVLTPEPSPVCHLQVAAVTGSVAFTPKELARTWSWTVLALCNKMKYCRRRASNLCALAGQCVSTHRPDLTNASELCFAANALHNLAIHKRVKTGRHFDVWYVSIWHVLDRK